MTVQATRTATEERPLQRVVPVKSSAPEAAKRRSSHDGQLDADQRARLGVQNGMRNGVAAQPISGMTTHHHCPALMRQKRIWLHDCIVRLETNETGCTRVEQTDGAVRAGATMKGLKTRDLRPYSTTTTRTKCSDPAV